MLCGSHTNTCDNLSVIPLYNSNSLVQTCAKGGAPCLPNHRILPQSTITTALYAYRASHDLCDVIIPAGHVTEDTVVR